MESLNIVVSVLWAIIFIMFLFGVEINPITEGGAYAIISIIFAKEALE